MRRQRPTRQRTAIPESLPPPIGGLNARDSVALMPATDALTLDNWFPNATSVDLRKGYTSHSTFTGQCESILIYTGLTLTEVFPCVVDDTTYSIYDGTSAGALSSAEVGGSSDTVQALTSVRFDSVNFGNTGGQYLFAVNGADSGLKYDGSTWAAWTVTGVDTEDIFTLALYAERLWLAESATFNVWYLGVNAITGTATKLNLASLFELGGSLSNIITWSADSASDLATHIGFISTEGEVNVFSGVDPSSAATWGRVAHFRIGRPVCKGQRAWCRMGSETVIICADGAFPLSRAILTGRSDTSVAVSDKIRTLFNRDLQLHGARFGWAAVLHPTGSKLIVNVPTLEDESSYQYVMNTQTKAWCRFVGWDAFCFAVARDTLYFGGDGIMVKADQNTADGTDAIAMDAKQAFSYFGSRGQTKRALMARPILQLDGGVTLQLGVNVDYGDATPDSTVTVSGAAGDPWDDLWSVAWSGAATIYRAWHTVRGVGFAFAPRLKGTAKDIQLSWSATDFTFEPMAGIL